MSRSVRVALLMSISGRETLPNVREWWEALVYAREW